MRPRVDWMTRADDYILELLRDADIAANPSTIGFNIDYDRRYVSEQCRELTENGLLKRVNEAKAKYWITEKSRKYLAGDLDASWNQSETHMNIIVWSTFYSLPDNMENYDHVMYASISHINQLFSQKYGDISQLDLETTEEVSSTFEGKLRTLVSFGGELSEGISRSEIESINFDDDLFQIKKIVNELLESDDIPSVSELFENGYAPNSLYRFSCPVLLNPTKGEIDDRKYLKVTGIEENVRFEGNTSLENWGSRSHLLTAMEVDEPYPFQGILTPVARGREMPNEVKYSVQFLFICAPNNEQRHRWHNRQALIQEQYDMKRDAD